MIRRMVYVSRAKSPMDRRMLRSIGYISSVNNTKEGITGLLLYRSGEFMQVLEGPPARIEEMTSRIWRDDRHTDVRELLDEQDRTRQFGQWAMGLLDLDSQTGAETDRCSEILRAFDKDQTDAGWTAKQLLDAFARQLPVETPGGEASPSAGA